MKGSSFKTIFAIFIIILILWAIYNSLLKNDKATIMPSQVASMKEGTIISNNLRIGIIEFDNINPILSNNKNVQDISRLIFEPLFTLTEDYKIEGVLAKECSKIDEKTYIVKLEENIRWHDGNKFDVYDVIFTIDMLKKIGTDSVYYYNVKDIVGIEEIDEYTIKIDIDKEIPYYEYNFIFPIVSSKYFNEENFMLESKNIKPVGTGPFYISETENNSILLKKNINNASNKMIKLDTVTLQLYSSLSMAINGFKKGEIDIFTSSNRNIEEQLKNTNYNKREYVNRNYQYIVLNCNNRVLANIEVRQAINSAINKEEIIKEVYNNKYKLSNFPLDFGSFSYDSNNPVMSYDANTSKGLLVDNGWKYSLKQWTKNLNYRYTKIELNILVNKDNSNTVKVANKVKEQLNAVGILVNIKEVSNTQYNEYLDNKNYDIIIVDSNYGYSPSLEKYFGENNLANYYNEEINTLLKEAELSGNDNEIKQKYTRITEIYNNDVPYISLAFNENTMIYSPNLKGSVNPNSYNLFYDIETWYREYAK